MTSRELCWIARTIAWPWCWPPARVRRISRSSVPWRRFRRSVVDILPQDGVPWVDCQPERKGVVSVCVGDGPQPLERRDLLRAIDRRTVQRLAHDLDRPVVGCTVDGKGRPVLAPMSKRETRRIAQARRRAVEQLRCEREAASRLRAD